MHHLFVNLFTMLVVRKVLQLDPEVGDLEGNLASPCQSPIFNISAFQSHGYVSSQV